MEPLQSIAGLYRIRAIESICPSLPTLQPENHREKVLLPGPIGMFREEPRQYLSGLLVPICLDLEQRYRVSGRYTPSMDWMQIAERLQDGHALRGDPGIPKKHTDLKRLFAILQGMKAPHFHLTNHRSSRN